MTASTAGPYETHSKEYKRAKRLHEKTTRGRNEHIETEWTPFRAAEKKYKAKFPPPDLSGVLDLALLDDARSDEVEQCKWKGSVDEIEYKELETAMIDAKGKRKAYVLPQVPGTRASICSSACTYSCSILHLNVIGLVLLPSFISPEEQRDLVRWSLKNHARYPNETNLDTHYLLPKEGLWNAYLRLKQEHEMTGIFPRVAASTSLEPQDNAGPRQLISNEPASKENFVKIASTPAAPAPPSQNARMSSPKELMPKLRWANIGWYYHWGNKQYDFTRGKIPVSDIYGSVCKRAVRAVPWDTVFDTRSGGEWGDEPSWTSWAESYGRSYGPFPQCIRRMTSFTQNLMPVL